MGFSGSGEAELVPRLRFPEFRYSEKWEVKTLSDLIKTVVPPKKIQTRQYFATGFFPIIDQSQDYIAGRTDDESAVIKSDFPLIVFGDHTCILKIIKEPFAQGADGIKIFSALSNVMTLYLYQYLLFDPIKSKEYKRHFSILKEKKIAFPKEKKEQEKIADCLSSLDDLINAESRKFNLLKQHKKGLMQQLFPAEGEAVPRLRFSAFKNSLDWENKSLGEVALFFKGKGISKADIVLDGKVLCVRYGELYTCYNEVIKDIFSKTNYPTSKLFFSQSNDVIIPASGETKIDIAKASCIMIDNVALGGDLNIIRSNHNGIFLSYYLNAVKKNEIAKVAQGDSVVHLYNDQLKKIKVLLPCKQEQQKIADCLSSLDDLILLQDQKINALKSHKRGLMQVLFPVLD